VLPTLNNSQDLDPDYLEASFSFEWILGHGSTGKWQCSDRLAAKKTLVRICANYVKKCTYPYSPLPTHTPSWRQAVRSSLELILVLLAFTCCAISASAELYVLFSFVLSSCFHYCFMSSGHQAGQMDFDFQKGMLRRKVSSDAVSSSHSASPMLSGESCLTDLKWFLRYSIVVISLSEGGTNCKVLWWACLSVCLSASMSCKYTKFSIHVDCGHG